MMDTGDILGFCFRKGILLDDEVLKMFQRTGDLESVKLILEKITNHTSQKIITKQIFQENKEDVVNILSDLPSDKQEEFKELKIKLG